MDPAAYRAELEKLIDKVDRILAQQREILRIVNRNAVPVDLVDTDEAARRWSGWG